MIFTELEFNDGKLVKYRAKDGFDALLRRSVPSGSPDYLFTELFNIYSAVKISMKEIGKFGSFPLAQLSDMAA